MGDANEESCYVQSPVGWLKIKADDQGLTGIEFLDEPPLPGASQVSNPHLKTAYRQLREYFDGERTRFDLQVNPRGTDFQRRVWSMLADVPFGTTVSYGDLAERLGKPGGGRAVGLANNKNPLPIVIPCHRVIGARGDLTGYASGVHIKETLLKLEGARPTPPGARGLVLSQ